MKYKKIAAFLWVITMSGFCFGEHECDKLNYFTQGWSAQLKKDCLEKIDSGNVEAVVIYGLHLIDINQVDKGLALLDLAAERKSSFALYWTGISYIEKAPSHDNYLRAINYLLQVEDDFKPSALTNIAVLYAEGKGVKYDMVEAVKLFKQSSIILVGWTSGEEKNKKINTDEWLTYQWNRSWAELKYHMDEYGISKDDVVGDE